MSGLDFVDNFVNDCIGKNICDTKGIIDEVNKQIDEINAEMANIEAYIKRMQELRVKKDNLTKVLREHGQVVSPKKRTKPLALIMDVSEVNIETYGSLIKDICQIFEKSNDGFMPRQIGDNVGFGDGDITSLYVTLKWLSEKGILTRGNDDNNRSYTKGNMFDTWRTLF